MLLRIPDVLSAHEVSEARRILDDANWVDGRVTAGHQSGKAKDNLQIPEDHPAARAIGGRIIASLEKNPLFISGALPLKIFPPLFNRYDTGQSFGLHIDNAIRQIPGTPFRVRTDLSATLFLSAPEDYDGGELVIEGTYGIQNVKLLAGHMILYPASSLHHVRPVTRGSRVSSFFWIQSMIRDESMRTNLFDLDSAIQRLSADQPGHPSIISLTGVYHNLLRQHGET